MQDEIRSNLKGKVNMINARLEYMSAHYFVQAQEDITSDMVTVSIIQKPDKVKKTVTLPPAEANAYLSGYQDALFNC